MATPSRTSKNITNPKDIQFLVNVKEEDITTSFFNDLFGEFESGRRFEPYDLITIPAGSYGPEGRKNKKPFTTTVGLWIFNKYFIEPHLFDMFKYIKRLIKSCLEKSMESFQRLFLKINCH